MRIASAAGTDGKPRELVLSSGTWFAALMEADGAQAASPKTVAAAPLTAVIARRVRELRQQADMRGSGLAAKLNELGVPWNRTTVAKFETGQRATISVQELLALALALDVPPAALLIAPGESSTPVADGVEPDPWSAILWLLGRRPLGRGDVGWSNEAGLLVSSIHQTLNALRNLEALENPIWSDEPPSQQQLDALDGWRETELRRMAAPLQLLADQGLHPPLPDYVRNRAQQLSIDLPGVEA